MAILTIAGLCLLGAIAGFTVAALLAAGRVADAEQSVLDAYSRGYAAGQGHARIRLQLSEQATAGGRASEQATTEHSA